MIQLVVAYNVTFDYWYTTLRGCWMKTGEEHMKLLNSDCVEPPWFGWLGLSTWQMAITNDL